MRKQSRTWTSSLLLLACMLLMGSAMAQQKKKIRTSELDQINGLFYQPNTIAPYSGLAFEDFPNGKKKIRIPIKDGKIHGKTNEWAKNGKKVHESTYEKGIQMGTETHWYATGQKKLQVAYQNGKPEGKCMEWHKNGEKKSSGKYVNGLEEGEHTWWYPNGQIDQIIPYKNGKTDGLVRQFYNSGKSRIETNYSMGLRQGSMKEWYESGQQKQEGQFAKDQKDGTFLDWSRKGRLLRKQVFAQDDLKEDYNYRNGSIRSHNGYIQIFNELESFFRVDITGANEVAHIRSRELTYSVDGMFLEVFVRPLASIEPKEGKLPDEEQAVLEEFVRKEVAFIQEKTEFPIKVTSEFVEQADGLSYIHWQFVSPSSQDEKQKARTVQHEHYLTFLCHKQLLNLYGVVTNSDDPAAVVAMMKRIAQSTQLHKERIDLNQIVRQLR
ncbi:MAG: toxin-antitoxin system YwqK family antitoxin [Bacteroidota bacterium]